MKLHASRTVISLCLGLACAMPLQAHVNLPSLGTVAESALPQAEEKRIGRDILRSLRDEGSVIDDAEVNAYLASIGARLVSAAQVRDLEFYFFAVRDKSVNAFALPGGVIGVHSGLLLTAQSESELAAVLGHEIAHVTQRHLARMQEGQGNRQLLVLAAVLAGILASRSDNGDLTAGVVNAGVGLAASQQLSYSRDFEREADRLGMQYLADAGFDPRASAQFFQRLQGVNRFNDNNAWGFLRTHPLNTERIAEAQQLAQSYPLRMVADSRDFLYMREKLRLETLGAPAAEQFYRAALSSGRYLDVAASQYGLARSLLALNQPAEARKALQEAQKAGAHPALYQLSGDIYRAESRLNEALREYRLGLQQYPSSRSLWLSQVDALLQSGQSAEAAGLIEQALRRSKEDPQLWRLAARSYGDKDGLRYHAALGHAFYFEQQYEAARLQYQLASRARGDDFYTRSSIEARLREIDTVLKQAKR